jgi:hypothetical protein
MESVLLTVHVAATWLMIGLIWFVQIVHYPLLGKIGLNEFTAYEQRHTELTSFVVGPAMFIEGISGLLLCWFRPANLPLEWAVLGVLLLIIIAASTAFIQVPCHDRLCKEFTTITHRRLVRTNWLRTVAWSLRGLLVCAMSCC